MASEVFADSTVFLAAIPPAVAAIAVAWFTYRAAIRSRPAVEQAAELEPRLSDVEQMSAGWKALIDAKDAELAHVRASTAAEIAELRRQLDDALSAVRTLRHLD